MRGTLEPSPNERGGSVLIVRTERRATDGQVTLDNRASPYLGRGQLQVSHAWNAVGERADRITLNARTSVPTGRSIGIGAGYDALIGANGTMLNLALSHARSNPRRELEPLDVKSRVTSALGTVTMPVIRSREENLRVFGQMGVRDIATDLSGIEFTRDKLRIVRAGVSYDRSDLWDGITTMRATLHQGLHGLGASDNGSPLASRVNGRSDFTKLTFDLTRLQQIAPRLSAVGSFTSQSPFTRLRVAYPPRCVSPVPQPFSTTRSPAFQSACVLALTTPARSMPGTIGNLRTTGDLPVMARPSL